MNRFMFHKQFKFILFSFILIGSSFLFSETAIAAPTEDDSVGTGFSSREMYTWHQQWQDDEVKQSFDLFQNEWTTFLTFVAAAALLTCILTFIVLMLKLGSSGDNPYVREKVTRDILVLLVTIAILGAASVVLALIFTTAFA